MTNPVHQQVWENQFMRGNRCRAEISGWVQNAADRVFEDSIWRQVMQLIWLPVAIRVGDDDAAH